MISKRSLLVEWGISCCSKKSNDMIDDDSNLYYNMRRSVIRLDQALLAVVSNTDYTLTIVHRDRQLATISSEERLVFSQHLPAMRKSYMSNNRVVNYHYILLVDRRHTWTLYRVKDDQQPPEQLYTGTLLSENYELGRVVGVLEVAGKVVLLFEGFRMLYLIFPVEDSPGMHILLREFLPYGGEPDYEHAKLAIRSYLPNEEDHEMLMCMYREVRNDVGTLMVGYRSRANQLCSIYTLEFSNCSGYLVSGKNVLQNIEQCISGIYPTQLPNVYIIQTKDCLVVWNISMESEQESTFIKHEIALKSHLSVVCKEAEVQGYTGVTSAGKPIMLSLGKKGRLEVDQLKVGAGDLQMIELQQINPKTIEYYCLTAQEELYIMTEGSRTKVVANEHTSICSSALRLHPNSNFILLQKKRGQQRGKLIYGNHLFTYQAEHYQHGLHLNNALLLSSEVNSKQASLYLTSPLIGLQKLNAALSVGKQSGKHVKLKGQSNFELIFQAVGRLQKSETLFLNGRFQISGEQVFELSKKNVSISRLFQDATDYVTAATVLSNELIALAIADQIHIFDSKLTRRYIYCCNGEVKSIFALNDVNLLGVEVFECGSNGNELAVLILEEEKARKMKTIPIPQCFDYIPMATVVNTAEFKIHLLGNRLILCSNDPLHRFQLEKILVQDYPLPLPTSSFHKLTLIPVFTLSNDKSNDFLVVMREERMESESPLEEVEVYFASFNSKYLLKKFDLASLTISYERVLTLSQLPSDQPIFAVMQQVQEGTGKSGSIFRHLLIVGQRMASVCTMKVGRVQLQWLQDRTYLSAELAKIQSLPVNIRQSCGQLPVSQPINILPTRKKEYFLVYNSREIIYTFSNGNRAEQVSYYSLINDDFTEFRNNVSVGELEDEQFMRVFNKKLVIKGLRYLSDSAILVLYDSAIVALEVGLNNALTVRQELKFKAHQGDPLHIEEFLQNYDQNSLYLRDAHGRIYILKDTQGTYEIVLHENMDEDVLLFSRVGGWHQRDRSYALGEKVERAGFEQELVLKKDGQLSVKSLNGSQDNNKFIYL